MFYGKLVQYYGEIKSTDLFYLIALPHRNLVDDETIPVTDYIQVLKFELRNTSKIWTIQ